MKLTEKISKTRLPSFIIVGAMKSGTKTLHYILNHHENIFIPDGEIFFFDIDDIEQHPDFFIEHSDRWFIPDYEGNFDNYLEWYKSFFKNANEKQVIGEDTTTYMASNKAPYRIAELLPNVKLIFMLRDPVLRTYSNYWHLVKTGRAIYDFEKTLKFMPNSLIQRGLYKKQIERYKNYFPSKNMKFIIFEDFIKNIQGTADDLCEFLGLETNIDTSKLNTHKNPARVPRSLRLQIFYNRIFGDVAAKNYLGKLPNTSADKSTKLVTLPAINDGAS